MRICTIASFLEKMLLAKSANINGVLTFPDLQYMYIYFMCKLRIQTI